MRIRHHAAEKPKCTAIPLVFKTKYNPHFAGKYIGQTLLKHWNIIEKNVRLKMVFPKPPMIAYSRSENLHNSLVKAKLPTPGRRMTTRILWEMRKIHHRSSPTLHTLQDLDLGSRGFSMFIYRLCGNRRRPKYTRTYSLQPETRSWRSFITSIPSTYARKNIPDKYGR